jgi:hypothetical protein
MSMSTNRMKFKVRLKWTCLIRTRWTHCPGAPHPLVFLHQTSLHAQREQMLAIRRYLTARQSRGDTRGDYDAIPLSELGTGHSISPLPATQLRSDQPLTLRRVSLTILSTIIAFTGFIFVFSLFGDGAEPDPIASAAPRHALQITGNGGFYRDAYPIRSMLKYWELAEREIKARGLDTCNGQLGRELIDAHIRTTVDYCHPLVGPAFW